MVCCENYVLDEFICVILSIPFPLSSKYLYFSNPYISIGTSLISFLFSKSSKHNYFYNSESDNYKRRFKFPSRNPPLINVERFKGKVPIKPSIFGTFGRLCVSTV